VVFFYRKIWLFLKKWLNNNTFILFVHFCCVTLNKKVKIYLEKNLLNTVKDVENIFLSVFWGIFLLAVICIVYRPGLNIQTRVKYLL